MKRITFKPEFVDKILSGEKTATSRWVPNNSKGFNPLNLQQWDDVAAVTSGTRITSEGKKRFVPAFLRPASEGFATLLIEQCEVIRWKEFKEEHAARCCVTREWYLAERPDAKPNDWIAIYGFRVVRISVDLEQANEGKGVKK